MTDSDVRSSFVSFVDHLPSDIIRKLWILQSLDTSYDAYKNELDTRLKQLGKLQVLSETRNSLVESTVNLIKNMKRIRVESAVEANSISDTIKLAKLKLENEDKQLHHDYTIYQNEIELRESLNKNSQRTNRRTNNVGTANIKIKFKVPNEVTQKRGRGRPPKIQFKTPIASKKSLKSSRDDFYDQDNEIYCVCKKPSSGSMVACDNPKCKIEWFHYKCVGLQRAPKGKWLCPTCRSKT